MPFQTIDLLARSSRRLRWLDWGMAALVGLSVMLGVVAVATFKSVEDRQAALNASVREDAVWAAYQVDASARKLAVALANAKLEMSPLALREIALRYDILFSRTDLLTGSAYATKFGRFSGLDEAAAKIRSLTLALEPVFDALARNENLAAGPDAALADLSKQVAILGGQAEALLNRANLAQLQLRVEERTSAAEAFDKLRFVVAALIATLAIIVVYLVAQLLHIRRSSNVLSILSLERAEAAARAEAGARAKSIFLATMSHEIRTPLNGIIGTVELLRDSPTDPDQKRKLAIVSECSGTLLALIDDILDFTKLDSGTLDFESVPTSVSDIVGSVVETFRSRAEQKRIAFEITGPDIPILDTDPTRIRQILFNLIGNAVKFTPTGIVSVDCRFDGEELSVSVNDTGIGIEAQARDRLFKDFSQLDVTINRRFGGTGLGLAICHRIVAGLGGSIGVRRREPQGSCFWFRIPARPSLTGLAVADPRQIPATNGAVSLRGRVLLAEDNAINLTVATEMLQRMGLDVTIAKDGREAVDLASRTPFDAILMDMQMPETDGLAATRELRAAGSSVPVIALTSNAMASDRQACFSAGMNDFIAKPINRSKLELALSSWLEHEGVAPPRREVGETAPIDLAFRAELAAELGEDVLARLTAQFWADARDMLRCAEAAWSSGDEAGGKRELHTLKGVAATLGLSAIAERAKLAESGEPDVSGSRLGAVRDALSAAELSLAGPATSGAYVELALAS